MGEQISYYLDIRLASNSSSPLSCFHLRTVHRKKKSLNVAQSRAFQPRVVEGDCVLFDLGLCIRALHIKRTSCYIPPLWVWGFKGVDAFFDQFTPNMAIMPLRRKGVLSVKENERTLEWTGNNPKQEAWHKSLLLLKRSGKIYMIFVNIVSINLLLAYLNKTAGLYKHQYISIISIMVHS